MRAHTFLDEKERRRWQHPEAILASINVRKGLVFVDVGCGDGFFAVPAARMVGGDGKVYCVDADPEAIKRLNKKATTEGLANLKLKAGLAEETVFCDSCADIVFFGIVFHDFSDQAKVLYSAGKMLKPTGRLIDLDWKKEPMPFGPPLHIRLSEEGASELIESAGFQIKEKRTAGPYHYVLVATPKH